MYNLLRRIVYSICLLYTLNLIVYIYGINIPINIYTIAIVTITDIFGIIGIVILKLFM